MERKSKSQLRREKIIRVGAIVIILALVLSVLAGAFSISPAQAAEPIKSVQIFQADESPVGSSIDTDGDGIVNNEDSDIDGDGIVNANDGDIDGDGASNFDDGDPAATNGFDGKTPNKPGSNSFQDLTQNGAVFWVIGVVILAGLVAWRFSRKSAKNRGKNAEKNI